MRHARRRQLRYGGKVAREVSAARQIVGHPRMVGHQKGGGKLEEGYVHSVRRLPCALSVG